jgi:hypothetical protein
MTIKDNYKAIVLVLASEDVENTKYAFRRIEDRWRPLYPHFKKVYEQYIYENENIKFFFLYGGDTNFERKEHDLVYDDVFENDYPGMITKTLLGMEYVTKNYNYDFLIRTNLSTFWNVKKLENRLDSLPKEKYLSGHYIKVANKETIYEYPAGFDMIMSKDIVEGILPYKEEIIKQKVHGNMEDLSITLAIEKYLNIKPDFANKGNRACWGACNPAFSEEKYQAIVSFANSENLDHFSVKTRTDRNIDKYIHERLLMDIYGKTIL